MNGVLIFGSSRKAEGIGRQESKKSIHPWAVGALWALGAYGAVGAVEDR